MKTADIVRHARCELREAIRADLVANNWLLTENTRGWLAKLSFDFWIDTNGDISTGDLTWVFPMNGGATFILNLGGALNESGNRREGIEFEEYIKELVEDNKIPCPGPDEHAGRFGRLAGYLGIVDLINRSTLSREAVYDANADFSKLSYTLEFIVKRSGNLSGKFNLIPIGKEKTFTGNPKWMGYRMDTQKLTLTLTPSAKPGTKKLCAANQKLKEDDVNCPRPVYMVSSPADIKTFVDRAEPPPRPRGIDPVDKAISDNARTRGLLQDIETRINVPR